MAFVWRLSGNNDGWLCDGPNFLGLIDGNDRARKMFSTRRSPVFQRMAARWPSHID